MSKFTRWRGGAIAATAAALVLTGCSSTPSDAEPPQGDDETRTVATGGDLVVGLHAETNVLDPTLGSEAVSAWILWSMCDRLYDVDEDSNLIPMLAQDLPQFSDDAMSATFSVRPDLKFQDGTPLDAEAVKASLERYATHPLSLRSGFIEVYESVEIVDDLTVRVNMTRPFTPLTAELADYTGVMISPTAFESAGDAFGDNPVCVGPYTLESRTPGTETKLTRAEIYHDLETQAKADTITYRIIRDTNARVANLVSGDVDIALAIPAIERQRIADAEDTDLLQVDGLGYYGLSINLHNTQGFQGPFGDVDSPLATYPELRKALEMTLDREQINETIYYGVNVPGCSPFGPAYSYYRERECTPVDIEGAKELVESTGLPTPITVHYLVSNNPDSIRFAELIQQMAAPAGFDIVIDTADNVATAQAGRSGDYEMTFTGWTGRYDPDNTFAGTIRTGAPYNYSGFNSPEIDKMLDDAAAITDIDERAEIYYDMIDKFAEERAFIYLYTPRDSLGYRSDVYPGTLLGNATPNLRGAGFLE